MKRYEEYKDSSVDIIGKIPKHWEIKKWKHITLVLTDYTANGSFGDLAKNVQYLDYKDYARLVRLTDLRENCENDGIYVNEKSYNYLSKSKLYGGEFLIANVGAYSGLVCKMPYIDERATLGPNMMMAKFDENTNNDFMVYVGNSIYAQIQLKERANRSSAQPKLNKDDFRSVLIAYPPKEEQDKIVAYLDEKTLQIDKLINKKEELIETLKISRQKLISETLIQGLDKDVEVKDSGIEWIGKIPKHWQVKKMKHISERIEVGIAESTTDSYSDNGVPIIRSTNVKDSTIGTEDLLYITKTFAEKNKSKYLYKGDLVTVRTGNVGRTAVVPKELDKSQCFTMLITTLKKVCNPYFYNYYINSNLVESYLNLVSWGTAQQNISVGILKELPVVFMSIEEQNHIVNFLNKEVDKLNNLIYKIEEQIKLLKKAKERLITEVVTGKIDVRE